MKVELIKPPKEITSDLLKAYLAECASVIRGKPPKDNDKLFNRLIKESYGGKPSRVFEYIPCVTTKGLEDWAIHKIQLFGFDDADCKYHTNARELLNWGWRWEDVVDVVDFTNYKAVRCTTPYFVYGQMSTHNQITSVSHSARYTESDLGYWYPEEFGFKDLKGRRQFVWDEMVRTYSPIALELYMKNTLGVKRREVFARGSDMLQYRSFTLGGYINGDNAWKHFINQRALDPHTQKETRLVANMIKDEIYEEDWNE